MLTLLLLVRILENWEGIELRLSVSTFSRSLCANRKKDYYSSFLKLAEEKWKIKFFLENANCIVGCAPNVFAFKENTTRVLFLLLK
jgi:hypothetical protein